MQFAASHETPGRCRPSAAPRVRSVNGREIAGDRDEDVSASVSFLPLAELPDSRL